MRRVHSQSFWISCCAVAVAVGCTPIGQPVSPDAAVASAGTSPTGGGAGATAAGKMDSASTGTTAQIASAKVGDACTSEGARSCAVNARRIPLLCDGATWSLQEPCSQEERCETALGSAQGTCVAIAPQCQDRADGVEFCDNIMVRTCRDQVSMVARTCGTNQRCAPKGTEITCVCMFGAIDRGNGCEIAPDCQIDYGGCDSLTMCSVVANQRKCSDCPAGYIGTGETGCSPLLAGLTVNTGVLAPTFSPTVHDYSLPLSLLQQQVQLTPSIPTGVGMEINGSSLTDASPWLSPVYPLGPSKVELVATSSTGAMSQYSISIDRAAMQEAYLKASDPEENDNFGYNLGISKDTVIVGAVYEDGAKGGVNQDPTNNGATDSGAAYAFVRNGGAWSQQAYFKADKPAANDFFGLNVAISGDTVVVGSTRSSPFAQLDSQRPGVAYIFVRNAGVWTQQAMLTGDSRDPDLFGYGVAIQGERVVVGAPYDNVGARQSGAVYVFERTGTTWSPGTKLKAAMPIASSMLGWSVALDGDTFVGGAPQDDQMDPSAGGMGSAYIFVHGAQGWTEQQRVQAAKPVNGDTFGWKLAIAGNTIAIGSPQAFALIGMPSGHIDVFSRTADTWSVTATLQAPVPRNADCYGSAVALSSTALIAGSCGDAGIGRGLNADPARAGATGSGAVYVYGLQNGTWTRSAYLKSSNSESGDFLGDSVAVDGDTIAATAPYEAGSSPGINGDQTKNGQDKAGAVFIFR